MRISDWSSDVCSSDRSRAFPRRKALAMSQILADLVRAQRVRTNAEQLARWSDPTPDGLEASPGYIPGFRAARNRRLPRPEFREINRGIPIDQLRQSIVEERSEERRVGKECVSTCRSRWSP